MWLISQGEVVEIPCPTALSRDVETNLTTSISATGYRRANYFGGANYLRTWSVDHTALPQGKAAILEAFTLSGFGNGGVGFVPTGAEHLNLFTPAQSLLATVTNAQRRTTTTASGVVYPSGVTVPEYTAIAAKTPFPYKGQRVTISAVTNGAATLAVRWLDASGAIISRSYAKSAGGDYARVANTVTAPANAVAFDAHVIGNIAAPAMTLGEVLRPWAVGQVAKSVVVNSPKSTLLAAWDPMRITSSKSYQVMEVGAYE